MSSGSGLERNFAGGASGIVLEDQRRLVYGHMDASSYLAKKMKPVLIENALRMLRVKDTSLAKALDRDLTLKWCDEVRSQDLPPEKGAR